MNKKRLLNTYLTVLCFSECKCVCSTDEVFFATLAVLSSRYADYKLIQAAIEIEGGRLWITPLGGTALMHVNKALRDVFTLALRNTPLGKLSYDK